MPVVRTGSPLDKVKLLIISVKLQDKITQIHSDQGPHFGIIDILAYIGGLLFLITFVVTPLIHSTVYIDKLNGEIAPYIFYKLSDNYVPKRNSSYESSPSNVSSQKSIRQQAKMGIKFA